jgi:hypothetical protein
LPKWRPADRGAGHAWRKNDLKHKHLKQREKTAGDLRQPRKFSSIVVQSTQRF